MGIMPIYLDVRFEWYVYGAQSPKAGGEGPSTVTGSSSIRIGWYQIGIYCFPNVQFIILSALQDTRIQRQSLIGIHLHTALMLLNVGIDEFE